ncbi:MAG: OmpA family protein [Thermodesulfovibrionales bacterium]|nr:OmpA family protein [Thermodesulfovibrionales bacterium]
MEKFQRAVLILFFTFSCLMPYSSAMGQEDDRGSKDHPMFSRIPNTYIDSYEEKEFDRYEFTDKQGKKVPVEGHMYSISYCIKRDVQAPSELQIIRNYQNAFKKIGGEVLYEDAEKTDMKITQGAAVLWVEVNPWNGGDCYTLAIAEQQAMVQDVVADAQSMSKGISETGKVVIYGIYFDFNKSEIKPESDLTLQEIAKLLSQNQKIRLYVVGHTDNVGDFDYNIKLSQSRADAVVKALVGKYGAEGSRMIPYGVGPLSPIASNNTEEGKDKNRRVELVEH